MSAPAPAPSNAPPAPSHDERGVTFSVLLVLLSLFADLVIGFSASLAVWTVQEGGPEIAGVVLLFFYALVILATAAVASTTALLAGRLRRHGVRRWWVRPALLADVYLLPAAVSLLVLANTYVPGPEEIAVELRVTAWVLAVVLAAGLLVAVGSTLVGVRRWNPPTGAEPSSGELTAVQRAWLAGGLGVPWVYAVLFWGAVVLGNPEDPTSPQAWDAVWRVVPLWLLAASLPGLGMRWALRGRRRHERSALPALLLSGVLLLVVGLTVAGTLVSWIQ